MAHGGDVYRNKIKLDFSVNINPLGAPEDVKQLLIDKISSVEIYPDDEPQELLSGLAEKIHVKYEQIILGNGASELIMAALHAYAPKKILLPVPSFTEYESMAKGLGIEIAYYQMQEENEFDIREDILEYITQDIDLMILTNPNNPTGRYIQKELLVKILKRCGKTETKLMLDECFVELGDRGSDESITNKIDEYKNLMIVRAFTKSFAIPGLRLGYMIASDNEMRDRISRHIPHWNISSLAQIAGTAALQSGYSLKTARELIKKERAFLACELEKLGMYCVPSSANFILFRLNDGRKNIDIYEEMLKRGILIRDCEDYTGLGRGWYRIAVKTHEENAELIKELIECLIKSNNAIYKD